MRVRDLVSLVERDGWSKVRQSGSHAIYRHPEKPGILVVPVHAGHELPAGTLNSILKKAGLK
jgi:predicted RNA binding protein YcfA (HicA-like mRNA interferase family)